MTRRLLNKFLGLLFLSFFWINLNSQDSLYFENLTSKEKYVLIVGIENVLKFDPSIDNILFNAVNILKNGANFKIRPNQAGPVTVMLFSGTVMKGSIDFDAKINKIDLQKNLDPKVRLGSLPGGGKISAYDLLNNSSLKIYTGDIVSTTQKIVSFHLTYIPKKGDIIEAEHNSAELNKAIIESIKQSKSGDVLLIENVKVLSPDSTMRRIPGLSYQIK
ncbi:MAG: hypothetical protein JNL75_10020 [Chitinophagales bacterium]|nr:hypothetical protein [Chitinophagales bacterium]